MDTDRTRGHSLRVKRVRTVVRQGVGSFTRKVVNAQNGLLPRVVTVKSVDCSRIELDGYLEVVGDAKYDCVGLMEPPALKNSLYFTPCKHLHCSSC